MISWPRYLIESRLGCHGLSFDKRQDILAGDDKRVLLWDLTNTLLSNAKPVPMRREHMSNVFAVAVNCDAHRIYSGGNYGIMLSHDVATRDIIAIDDFTCTIYCIATHPVDADVCVIGTDDGVLMQVDSRAAMASIAGGSGNTQLHRGTSTIHSVAYHPVDARYVLTGSANDGAEMWDLRHMAQHVQRLGNWSNVMHAGFSHDGDRVVVLPRGSSIHVYNMATGGGQQQHRATFSNTNGYINLCTLKSCDFVGPDDRYIAAGSDDFNVYMWRVPDIGDGDVTVGAEACTLLHGHRSIVNHVRYNRLRHFLMSSGVEKIIKHWSACHYPLNKGPSDEPQPAVLRKLYTHQQFIDVILNSHAMTHDYATQNVEEDECMLAFFDSSLRRQCKPAELQEMLKDSSSSTSVSSLSSSSESEPSHDDSSVTISPAASHNGDTDSCFGDSDDSSRPLPSSQLRALVRVGDEQLRQGLRHAERESNDRNFSSSSSSSTEPEDKFSSQLVSKMLSARRLCSAQRKRRHESLKQIRRCERDENENDDSLATEYASSELIRELYDTVSGSDGIANLEEEHPLMWREFQQFKRKFERMRRAFKRRLLAKRLRRKRMPDNSLSSPVDKRQRQQSSDDDSDSDNHDNSTCA